jgi:lipopolysaccharide/colanic/teichoic acid biosynthesis glycosyltransferase
MSNQTDSISFVGHATIHEHAPNVALDGLRTGAQLRRGCLLLGLLLRDAGPYIRRTIDLGVVGLALILVAPILAVAALAIRLTSRGPVFFRQERIGWHGRAFPLFKMRTMICGADALKAALAAKQDAASGGVRFKMARDPRVTAVGRFLRKYSIDELPQLWNVFVGHMTLIGPRPPLRSEVVLYDTRALRRLEVQPGLTCLWQVGGRSALSFDDQVNLDLEYIDRIRPAQEIGIVLKTVPAVLSGRGAY